MISYILDASAAAAWLLPAADEPLADQANQIQRGYAGGQIQLLAPDLILPEIGNVLCKATRRARISAGSAKDALDKFLALGIPVVPTRSLMKQALSIAEMRGGSVYDCVYIALATILQRPLLTADERLANMMSAYYPVRWLGAI